MSVGVVPSLPMKGVGFLLGNDVAGGKVSASPIVSGEPVDHSQKFILWRRSFQKSSLNVQ